MFTVIVDPCPLLLRGLQHSLAKTKFRCGLAVTRIEDVPDDAISNQAALLIVGISEDWPRQIAAIKRVRSINVGLPIVVLYDRIDSDNGMAVMEAGASAVVGKSVSCEALTNYLELAALGEVVVPLSMAKALRVRNLQAPPRQGSTSPEETRASSNDRSRGRVDLASSGLSKREEAILVHLLKGASNKGIARLLQLSEATVKVHVKAVFRKLRVKNRTQAAMWGASFLPGASEELTDSSEVAFAIRPPEGSNGKSTIAHLEAGPLLHAR